MSIGIKYRTHVSNFGWQDWVKDGQTSGTVQQATAFEALQIELTDVPPDVNLGVTYYVHVQDLGWSDPEVNGGIGGSTGLGKHAEAVRIGLFGNDADKYDIFYKLYIQDKGWMNWSKNGEYNGTVDGNLQAEAIQIVIASKSENVYPAVDNPNAFEVIQRIQPEPEPAKPNEDVLRARVIEVAQGEIGYRAQTNSKYGLAYGNASDYCADFDRWCYAQVGLKNVPQTGYCPTAKDVWEEQSRWRDRNYVPRNGDLIYFDYNYNGVPDHTGIVEGSDGSTVTTIEGNTGYPTGVYKKSYKVGSNKIIGYGIPEF